jgi:RNA-binding protein
MQDSDIDRKRFKAIGHSLKPVIIISHKGLTANIRNEIDRALSDHELIKIKILTAKRADRDDISKEICRHHNAEYIQGIGHVILIYRPSKNTSARLSNLYEKKP